MNAIGTCTFFKILIAFYLVLAGTLSSADDAEQEKAMQRAEEITQHIHTKPWLFDQYMAAQAAFDAEKNSKVRDRLVQGLLNYKTFVGDYLVTSEHLTVRSIRANIPSEPLTDAFSPKSALDTIAELARPRQAVFFNEAHTSPVSRTLTLQLLQRLKREGFNYFAAETLAEATTLTQRGYPIKNTGFYTNEPIYGEMLRLAVQLGYKIVPYEIDKGVLPSAREQQQAEHLYERVFKVDPAARLIVHAGYGHVYKWGLIGDVIKPMGVEFRQLTGIDPLVIEQTKLFPDNPLNQEPPLYRKALKKYKITEPVVFTNAAGKPWSFQPERYDVSVFFPAQKVRDGRPTWLNLGGMRQSYPVFGKLCKKSLPCLVEARYASEGPDAIPADRLVLRKNSEKSALYLRPGRYHLKMTAENEKVVDESAIVVNE